MSSTREVAVQDKLYKLIYESIRNARFDGVELTIEREYPVGDNKRADLAIIDKETKMPILIIETKRKYVEAGTFKTNPRIHPVSSSVLGQALCYAYLIKRDQKLPTTPLFATANPDGIFLFRPVEKPEKFIDIRACEESRYADVLKPGALNALVDSYRLDILKVREDEVQKMLETSVKVWKMTVNLQQVQIGLDNWFIEYLRINFIDALMNYGAAEYMRAELETNNRQNKYYALLDRLARDNGYKNGLADIVGSNLERVEDLARMMLYVLMNKIIFYKVLEKNYQLPKLPECKSPAKYLKDLRERFEDAIAKTKDFEAVFITGLYDEIRLPGDPAICDVLNDFNKLLDEVDILQIGDVIGYIYERLIPAEERHRLGQFYTPPAVAKLIARWTIRDSSDKVLDPGTGSGTFLTEAYARLYLLKTGRDLQTSRPSKEVHEAILSQLYGIDINAFPLQLTAVNLSMRNVRAPSTQLKLIHQDFFAIMPNQQVLLPYRLVTANKVVDKSEVVPGDFDAVVGNPPYTRWVEIPDSTQNLILNTLSNELQRYDLRPDPRRGREPGIYVYWIMHATRFLKEGGRLGMIISNMWLQTDYGVEFGKFLLDNYRIRALIDVSYRLFTALISTVIVLAEKDASRNKDNEVLLARVPPIDSKLSDRDVENKLSEILDCIGSAVDEDSYEFNKEKLRECQKLGVRYHFIKQSEIPRDRKWISLFFGGVEDVVNKLEELASEGKLMIRAGEWFKPSYGNAVYLCLSSWGKVGGVRNLGAKEFFYFNEDKAKRWGFTHICHEEDVKGLHCCLAPAITRSQWVKTFIFSRDDWERLRREGKDVYLFMCHEPSDKLSENVREYIKWGESDECRTRISGTRGGGRRCSEAVACEARQKVGSPWFYGWYDLGGYIPTPIMAIRQAGYHPQFFLAEMSLVTYDAIITFIPRVRVKVGNWVFDPVEWNKKYGNIIDGVKSGVELDEAEVKALLAYLNSTLNWLWLEQNGRRTGGGILALEVNTAEMMPILNVKALDGGVVSELARLFDELEAEARRLMGLKPAGDPPGEEEEEEVGGAKLEMFKRLKPKFLEIDKKIAQALGLGVDVEELWSYAWEMMERRVKGAERIARPGARPLENRQESSRRRRRGGGSPPGVDLTMFF
ncbi:N-6 DNA methylase [Pyrobaculum sp. 3827-6]|uniref:HsdM family class I SAM-dependent methyltransferase n=1 Tax=Pyrobaculum sp. 3827-6 TaxID=2983604 RepID=UPI0021DA6507|nr:N-6 DNA methylase [Pyrobaculum sp. 3827-6]MCU7788309.1 N-6 DNA methylase [Pyrobaculum sp. 3827-6]